eukprot:scaffold43324_cov445-Skeletonema_marinoi.AAC.1
MERWWRSRRRDFVGDGIYSDVLPTVLSMIGKDIPIGIEVDGIDVTDDFLGQAQSSSSSLLLQNE